MYGQADLPNHGEGAEQGVHGGPRARRLFCGGAGDVGDELAGVVDGTSDDSGLGAGGRLADGACSSALGYAVKPISEYEQEMALAMLARMRNREGQFFCQAAALSLPGVPRAAVEMMFSSAAAPVTSMDTVITWRMESTAEIAADMLDKFKKWW